MNEYATLADLREYLGLSDSETDDDEILRRLLRNASRIVDAVCGRHFYPMRDRRSYIVSGDDKVTLLGMDLLEAESLADADGNELEPESYCLCPLDGLPKSWVAWVWPQVGEVRLTGVWGYHDDWAGAWQDSADSVQDDPLTTGSTVLTVADADGEDAEGIAPRFRPGYLIRVGSEYMSVLDVDAVDNTLTVRRGVNGTTAMQHEKGMAISVYRPPEPIVQVTIWLAAWLYRQRDSVGLSPPMPDGVLESLAPFRRLRVG